MMYSLGTVQYTSSQTDGPTDTQIDDIIMTLADHTGCQRMIGYKVSKSSTSLNQ